MTINSDIDKLFKQGLADHSEKAPDFIWNGIEEALKLKRQKKRRNAMYAMAASVALLLSFGAGYLLTENNTPQVAENNAMVTTAPENVLPKTTNNKETKTNSSNKEAAVTAKSQPEPQNTARDTEKEVVPVIKNNTPTKKPTKIQRKKAEGTLLPPMFAASESIEPESTNSPKELGDEHELEKIDIINITINQKTEEPSLKYEIRQVPVYESHLAVNNVKPEPSKNWSVGLNASPLYSYRDVYEVPQQDVMAAASNVSSYELNYTNEKPLVSYAAGVDVNYNINKRWEVKSGFYMAEIGQVSENINLNKVATYNDTKSTSYSINTSSGNMVVNGSPNELIQKLDPTSKETVSYNGPLLPGADRTDNATSFKTNFVQTYEYYEVPLVVNYKLIDRKIGLKVGGGVSANFLSKNSNYVEEEGNRYNIDAKMENTNNTTYSGIFGIGFEYPIVKALDFNLQPTFRYNLNPISNAGNVYPYSFGIFTGLKYSF